MKLYLQKLGSGLDLAHRLPTPDTFSVRSGDEEEAARRLRGGLQEGSRKTRAAWCLGRQGKEGRTASSVE